MSNFETTPPIPYVPLADKAAEVRLAIDAARLSAANSFGGLQKLAIPGPFATDAEASTFGVPDDNLYYRSDGTVRAASHISLDLAFALDKTLTARTGPTPTFSRASSGLFVNANGILVGKTAGTTVSLNPTTTTVGTTEVTVTVASGSVGGWLVGQSVSLIVDSNANNAPDTGELWLVGDIVSMTATQLVFKVTSKGTTSASATDWTLGYRGARFDHDPATGVCKGLLIEESRENRMARSEEFDHSGWIKLRTSVDDNATTDPAGTLNADKLIEDSSTGTHMTYRTAVLSSLVPHTFSVYAKADGRNFMYLQCGDGFPVNCHAYFDLSTGIKGTVGANATANIEPAGNGWYRCSVTATPISTSTNIFYIQPTAVNGSTSYAGDGTSGLYLWGAQVEAGAFPTSYIPTTSGTAARSADVCSIAGTDFSSFYNQSEGTLLLGCSSFANSATLPSERAIVISDGTTSNRLSVANIPSGFTAPGLSMVFVVTSGGSAIAALGRIGLDTTSLNVLAGAYKVNDFASSTNGSAVDTVTTGAVPVGLDRVDIGNQLGTERLNGHIARVQYFRKRLSNAKLQTLTTP